ncbi:hypothetical protein LTR05_001144 [Lithohypha guttulata]|uniref:Uncharacterized protein n=1 Tax=Lithohypha guttulata TaxID=1690604 RepID=A0AAN7T8M6_9EURO|nr:hypothetical protein LTR05_001144 [Lithohypha guttulata]
MNALTEAIAGPHRVRDSQERAAQRRFAGLDKKMKEIRDVSPEAPPSVGSALGSTRPPNDTSRAQSRASSRAQSPGRQTRPLRPRPELQRSQSELPIQARQLRSRPLMPPCITAMDLDAEQMKRNYSLEDLQRWDRAKSPMPPLYPMMGVGRYRTSISADPQWRSEHLKKQLSSLDGLESMVASLDIADLTGDTSVSSEEWQQITGLGGRRDSAISSNSTRTTSSTGLQDLTDSQGSRRVERGFSPSASSLRSSFGVHSRKGSNLSIVSRPSDVDASLLQKPLHRQSVVLGSERRVSGPMSTIKELNPNALLVGEIQKKVQKPCEFITTGDPESAVASDVDDPEEDAWTDEGESAKVSVITQMLKEGRQCEPQPDLTRTRTMSSDMKRARGSTTSIDRSRTVRTHAGPSRRKKSSKNDVPSHQRAKSEDKKTEKAFPALPSPESNEDGPEIVMQRQESTRRIAKNQKKHSMTTISKETDRVTDDDTLIAENQHEYLPRAPRNRSATALRFESAASAQPTTD